MRLRHCLLVLVSVLGLLMLSPVTNVCGKQASNINEASNIKDAPGDVEKTDAEKTDAKKTEAEKSINEVAPVPVPTPMQLSHANKTYESAYKDTYNILSENNSCSSFYGGPHVAVMVFNQLVGQLRTEYDRDPSVGISMTTPVTNVDDHQTGYSYRLFAKAKLNSNGPFYKSRVPQTDKWIPGIGAFQANTREARALMLLHELGHLMKGPDQQWLLQDDGDDPLLSFKNTKTVEAHCAKQIKGLGEGVSSAGFLAGRKSFGRAAESTTAIRARNDKPASQ
jgi:hypothetical protein